MSNKSHQYKSSDDDRSRVDNSSKLSSRTVIYEQTSSTLKSSVRQVVQPSSSSFYNTSTTSKIVPTKPLTIRSGKHSRAINSDIYHSEIVDEDDEDDEREEGEMDYSNVDEQQQMNKRTHQNSSDERTKRARQSSSPSDNQSVERKRKGQRSPSEEGEEAESISGESNDHEEHSERINDDERRQRTHSNTDNDDEEPPPPAPHRSRFDDEDEQEPPPPAPHRSRFDDQDDDNEQEPPPPAPHRSRFDDQDDDDEPEGNSDSNDDDDDDDENHSDRQHSHHHHRHHHHKRSRRHSSSTPQSYSSKSAMTPPIHNHSQTEKEIIEDKPQLPNYYPAIQGCRRVDEYACLSRIEEGTYGVVFRAKDKKTGEIVALKRLKMEKEKEGFPITSLREICCILKSQHENVCHVREIVVGDDMNRIFIVMDYVEHDLKSLMTHTMKKPFTIGEIKTLMYQLLAGVNHLHDNWIIHRDLKTSNLLLSNKGILKIADFGLAREYGSPLKPYTSVVVTLWYRAPELLLGVKEYSTSIDIWSVGAIFGELLLMKPLFPGKSELDQLNCIFKDLGTPNEKIWPEYKSLPFTKKMTFSNYPYNRLRQRFDSSLSEKGFDLLNKFLTYDPVKRISALSAFKHPYFEESPRRIDPSMFPTWPSRSAEKDMR